MYNIIRKLIERGARIRHTAAALLLVFFVSGCSVNAVRVKLEKNGNENDTEKVKIETPVITGMKKSFTDEINAQMSDIITSKTESFRETAQKTQNDRSCKAELEISTEVKYNKKNLLSFVIEAYEYTSGFNGASSRYAVTIDAAEKKQLQLCDLFCDEEYKDMLNARLEKLSLTDEYSDIWEKPVVGEAQNENFYLSNGGLVLYYKPYELSYYSRGFVEFTIPYSELYGYLKSEYAVLY